MSTVDRGNWSREIDAVIRSRHYTWLPAGLDGQPADSAMATLVADIMHFCKREGINWPQTLQRGEAMFEQEEAEYLN